MTLTPSRPAAAPVAQDLVSLTIDGIEVSVPKGTLLIRAAEQVGVQIPRFCDHPLLAPVGACRQCLVEVAMPGPNGEVRTMMGPPGRVKPQASCTLPVAEGMVVNTQLTSPVADKAQHGVMEQLLLNHPLDCPVCDKGGDVERPGRDPVHRGQADLPEADQHLRAGAPGPGALRALCAVHEVLRADRR
jgi:NADH-quinone oxidoreductase subunit G